MDEDIIEPTINIENSNVIAESYGVEPSPTITTRDLPEIQATDVGLNETITPYDTTVVNPNVDPYASIAQREYGQLKEQYPSEPDPGIKGADYDTNPNTTRGIPSSKNVVNKKAVKQDLTNFQSKTDWRVRISLAPDAKYFYKSENQDDVGILWPLQLTDGVIFPYTPTVSVNYNASYDSQTIPHSNYKIPHYTGSSVDNITIGCEFTAQDTNEAAYVLAVIHFFRSVTKMFYGNDNNPVNGTPPPLCYLHGYGKYQFDKHPMVITSFNYSLPVDVDYIRTNDIKFIGQSKDMDPRINSLGIGKQGKDIASRNAPVGGSNNKVDWSTVGRKDRYDGEPTYVPSKINIQISAIPVVTRNNISNNFSLRKYASGDLLLGTQNKNTGIW